MQNPFGPSEALQESIVTLAAYTKDVVAYVQEAIRLPTKRPEYLEHLGIDKESEALKQFDRNVDQIIRVYYSMNDHCTKYNEGTHLQIVGLAVNIIKYSTMAEPEYQAISDHIKQMADATGISPDRVKLHSLIEENIVKINKYRKQSEASKTLLNNFLDLTSLDFEAADKESKELDALLRDYTGELFLIHTVTHDSEWTLTWHCSSRIKDASDSADSATRVYDKPATRWQKIKTQNPLTSHKAKKQEKRSRKTVEDLSTIKRDGDCMKDNLVKIRDLANSAVNALEGLIGGLDDISKNLETIRHLVDTNLRQAEELVVDCQKANILKHWHDLGERGFMFPQPIKLRRDPKIDDSCLVHI